MYMYIYLINFKVYLKLNIKFWNILFFLIIFLLNLLEFYTLFFYTFWFLCKYFVNKIANVIYNNYLDRKCKEMEYEILISLIKGWLGEVMYFRIWCLILDKFWGLLNRCVCICRIFYCWRCRYLFDFVCIF